MQTRNLKPHHVAELRRHYNNTAYERADHGRVFVPKMGLFIGGVFRHMVNGADPQTDPNLFTLEGRTDVLAVYFDQKTQTSKLYLAPYSGNVSPDETWTATGAGSTPAFASSATELTGTTTYTEATRVEFKRGTATDAEISNASEPAIFTIGSAGATIRGFGLLSVATKGATTGRLVAVANLGAARTGLTEGDKLSLEYSIVADD